MVVLRRKAYRDILRWKESSRGRSALLINGARRVGKSYIAEEFGKNEYRSYIVINFADEAGYADVFRNDMDDLDFFFNKISSMKDTKLYDRDSLIILDEIQTCPLARQSVKRLVADGRYDYIETGSLLSIGANVKGIVIPSEEDNLDLHPLDFEEFLWALGNETSVPHIQECYDRRIPVGEQTHRKLMNRLREYILVGGMPQAVLEYVLTKDFQRVDSVKRRILNLYRKDIGKYAKGYGMKVVAAYDQIPSQLSKKEKKFSLSSIDKNARTRSYEDAFFWLSDGMITNNCYNATDPAFGLGLSLDSSKAKYYMADTGLLVSHTFFRSGYSDNTLYKAILSGRLSINEGMLMENYVAQALRSNGHELFFYSRPRAEDNPVSIEIDFLIRLGGTIHPVEVKSSSTTRHISLDRFVDKFGKRVGEPMILCPQDLQEKDGVLYIPLYMAILLRSRGA